MRKKIKFPHDSNERASGVLWCKGKQYSGNYALANKFLSLTACSPLPLLKNHPLQTYCNLNLLT